MDWLNATLGGIGGVIIASIVALFIHFSSKPKKTGLAYELLKKLRFLLKNSEADYYFCKSANENYHVARLIYSDADAEIIATAFNENPETYGELDIVRDFRYGSLFTRITCEDICSSQSIENCRKNMSKILRGSTLVVVPKNDPITKIDGIFCRFKDDSYLCAISFRDPQKSEDNKGIVFRDGMAESFFNYYKTIVKNIIAKNIYIV
jgi:hypothetical protein